MATTTITKTAAGTYTFICPPGVTSIQVEAWGGGGAGGQRTSNGGGGGGGGGEYAKEATLSVSPGTSYTYVVGTAGVSNGADGGNSTFGSTLVVAHGGKTVANNTVTGGNGGSGSTNTVHYNGGNGFTSAGTDGGGGGSSAGTGSAGVNATSATGATAPAGGGNGGAGATVNNTAGTAGSDPGGGGGGGKRTSSGTRAGGAGGVGKIVITYTTPKTENITDNFDDNSRNTALWSVTGTASETSNGLVISVASGAANYSGFYSLEYYDLTASYSYAKVTNAGNQALNSLQAIPVFLQDSSTNNRLVWYINQNKLYAQKFVSGVATDIRGDVTYNSSVHVYFKIREASGTVYWDYSTDGSSWTNYTSTATPITITALQVVAQAGAYSAEASSTSVTVDNVNTISVVSTAGSFFYGVL